MTEQRAVRPGFDSW